VNNLPNWPMLIAALRQSGLSYYKIALAVGVPSTHYVRRWGNGTIPLHPHGEALIALHNAVCAGAIEQSRGSASLGPNERPL